MQFSDDVTAGWTHTKESVNRESLLKMIKAAAEEEERRSKISEEEARLSLGRQRVVIEETQRLLSYNTDRYKEIHQGLMHSKMLKERDEMLELKRGQQEREQRENIREEQECLEKARKLAQMEVARQAERKMMELEWEKKRRAQIQEKKLREENERRLDRELLQRFVEAVEDDVRKERQLQEVEKLERRTLFESQTTDRRNKSDSKAKLNLEDEELYRRMLSQQKDISDNKVAHAKLFHERQNRIAERQEYVADLKRKAIAERDRLIEEERVAGRVLEFKLPEGGVKEKDRKHCVEHNLKVITERVAAEKEKGLEDRRDIMKKIHSDKAYVDGLADRKVGERKKCRELRDFWDHQIKERKDRATALMDKEKGRLAEIKRLNNVEDDEIERYVEKVISDQQCHELNVIPIVRAKQRLGLGR